jgi:hypothetical protein
MDVIQTTLNNNSEVLVTIKNELIILTNLVVNQNYFEFNTTCYKQIEGLGMGVPTSALFAEIFLQWLEHMSIVTILSIHRILGYYRYVDDILTLCNLDATHIDLVLTVFNKLHPSLTFTLENKINSSINVLDLTI